MTTRSRLFLIGCLLPLAIQAAWSAESEIAPRVLGSVQAARREAGLTPLTPRADLQRVAEARARQLAALPHGKRLAAPVEGKLREAGIRHFRRASVHVDLNRGYVDPAAAFARSWRDYAQGWDNAMAEWYDAIGLASATAEDGWIVLVAILIEQEEIRARPALGQLEEATLRSVNRVRAERGLRTLIKSDALIRIAREHCEDMIRRTYFAHESPEGAPPAERLRTHGVPYSRIGENLHRSLGVDDPVETAVSAWLASEGHRQVMLSDAYSESGVGIATDEEGALYFTQLFLAPPE